MNILKLCILSSVLLALAFGLAACSGSGNGQQDAGYDGATDGSGNGEAGDSDGIRRGPKIFVDVNVRNLFNEPVSGEQEQRCTTPADCGLSTPICWTSPDTTHLKKGFCRECNNDTNCTLSKKCDHGFCHTPCTTTADCASISGSFCTAGMCRQPSFSVEINFANAGDENLEIYTDKLELHGHDDACAFPLSRMDWSTTDTTITLVPEASANWRVRFTPPAVDPNTGVGAYRAIAIVVSNDKSMPKLPFFLCGEAVEAVCNMDFDNCGNHISCADADFKGLDVLNPDCSSVK